MKNVNVICCREHKANAIPAFLLGIVVVGGCNSSVLEPALNDGQHAAIRGELQSREGGTGDLHIDTFEATGEKATSGAAAVLRSGAGMASEGLGQAAEAINSGNVPYAEPPEGKGKSPIGVDPSF